MFVRPICFVLMALAVVASSPVPGWAVGFDLGETKDELKLDYDVSVYDHGTGRVTVKFTLAAAGRLTPLTSIDLSIPSKDKHQGGGYMSDLSLTLATRDVDGNQVASVHLRKDWAERAEIWLKTSHLDGEQQLLTWYYHRIPVADHLKADVREKEPEH